MACECLTFFLTHHWDILVCWQDVFQQLPCGICEAMYNSLKGMDWEQDTILRRLLYDSYYE